MKTIRFAAAWACIAASLSGCVRITDVRTDARLRQEAQTAFAAGDFGQTRRLIARADKLYVPSSELWRRTLELRIALAEGAPRGELRKFLQAWAEQRSDWRPEDCADAELTLAETFRREYALDWLYDLDPAPWPQALRSRHNLLFTRLQSGDMAFYDETVTRWRLAIQELYRAGRVDEARDEAFRCARETRNVEAALIAAKLSNELGDEKGKAEALELARAASDSADVRQRIVLIQSAPSGTRLTL